MPAERPLTLTKGERLCSRTLIDRLFAGGHSRSLAAFPVRVVYMMKDRDGLEPQAQVMFSVSKRRFKRAVKRNRVKRQLREAYRQNKYIVLDALRDRELFDQTVVIAFIWLDDKLHTSEDVTRSVVNLLRRISEKL